MESGFFRIDPTDSRPIWRQIEESVRHLIASGALQPSAASPSVRDMARLLAVNPATVAKAYQRLTDGGVLVVRRGDGTYVATAPPRLNGEQRSERLDAAALRYASFATTLGATADEAAAALAGAWANLAASGSAPDATNRPPGAEPPQATRPGRAGREDREDALDRGDRSGRPERSNRLEAAEQPAGVAGLVGQEGAEEP
jgi:GntR family transcriptional regulator